MQTVAFYNSSLTSGNKIIQLICAVICSFSFLSVVHVRRYFYLNSINASDNNLEVGNMLLCCAFFGSNVLYLSFAAWFSSFALAVDGRGRCG